MKNSNRKPKVERGAASIFIQLSNGKITVTHGTAAVTLHEIKNAQSGSWDKIWKTIRAIKSVEPEN